MTSTISHPVFRAALAEIESLDVRVSAEPIPGATPYAIVGGRSNARWWLIPLTNRQVAMSGLAMFQPILASAKLIKQTVLTLSRMGLQSMWARPALYLAGTPCLARHLGNDARSFAYFTGTDSPHRKLAVQVMDETGRLLGFAKVTRNPLVNPLLRHEANTLGFVNRLGLATAKVPKVLFAGEENGSGLLVTDTLKTSASATSTDLLPAHVAFLKELSDKTTSPHPDSIDGPRRVAEVQCDEARSESRVLSDRFGRLESRLAAEWQKRLAKAIRRLEVDGLASDIPCSLAHGDFTPWNTFFVGDKLYVFDWEYANPRGTVVSDLIHFLLAAPRLQRCAPGERVAAITKRLQQDFGIASQAAAVTHLLHYLASHTLGYVERQVHQPGPINTWDGMPGCADLFAAILGPGGRE